MSLAKPFRNNPEFFSVPQQDDEYKSLNFMISWVVSHMPFSPLQTSVDTLWQDGSYVHRHPSPVERTRAVTLL